jgi:uncharacterized phiE125 gp8 family phage protein
MMFARQYGSLTGAVAYQYFPEQTVIVSQDTFTPVTLAEAKNFLRVYDDVDDTSIQSLLVGVTQQVEQYIGKDTTPRVRLSFWSRPKQLISIPRSPVGTITNVTEVSRDGTEQVVLATEYVVEGLDLKSIRFSHSYNALKVTYNSGYDNCPDAIKGAILQELSLQYKNRQDSAQPSRTSVNGLSIEARHLLLGGGFYDYSR